ncbi:MAG: 50S ribosomal protein L18 [Anaerolineaceae bacterium]|jgi:large subunit ribosomal protein L18|nr:50S ribosomal protein L18 [Chloroflexota bacterium]HZK16653.1 50S ribosomal protein L18 [Anaerolineaceae bacterium]
MAKKSRNQARLHRHARVRKKVYGTPERPRLNVFRSITDIYVQIIDDHSGTTLAAASSIDAALRETLKGKSKVEQAQLVGEEIAKRAKDKGISTVVMDRGGYIYTGRVKSLAEGARKGGLEF